MDDIKKDIIEKLRGFEQEEKRLQTEFESRIAELRQSYEPRIQSLNKRLESYRTVAEDYHLLEETDEPSISTEQTSDTALSNDYQQGTPPLLSMTLGDAIETALRSSREHLSIDQLMKKLLDLGISPKRDSLRSALSKDTRDRFESSGRGVYKLRESVANTPQLVGVVKNNSGFSFTEALDEVLPEFEDKEFTVQSVLDALIKKYPENDILQKRRTSISAFLSMRFSNGEIERVYEGKGGQPSIYKLKSATTQNNEEIKTNEVVANSLFSTNVNGMNAREVEESFS